jgi:serine/threonine-protein phosphatase 2A regulatory subunit A
LNPICLTWLKDQIFTIREAALNNFKQLTVVFGHQWASRNVIPKIMWQASDANYLHRVTPLISMSIMADVVPGETVKVHFLPVLTTLSKDRVANIRMNVAKSIQAMLPHLKGQPANQETLEKFKSILQELIKDEDTDVKYYSQKALSSI